MKFPNKLAAGVAFPLLLLLACPADAQSAVQLVKQHRVVRDFGSDGTTTTHDTTTREAPERTLSADPTPPENTVCFYEDVDYRGKETCASEGTARVSSALDNRVSSLKVKPGHSVQMYQYFNHSGRSVTIIGDEPNLVARKFNDTMSSFKLNTGKARVCFYEDVDYAGASYCTDASAVQMPNGWNDRASSVRVQPGYSVRLYQHNGYGGSSISLTKNEPNLVGRSFNDAASSFRVAKSN